MLSAARARNGESIDDVANALRIRKGFLEAIESDRFGDLPAAAYAIGFIRSYAEHLGLDADELVGRFKDQAVGADTQPRLDFPVPIPRDARVPGAAIVMISLIIGAGAYGAWYFSRSDTPPIVALVPDPPESPPSTRRRRPTGSRRPPTGPSPPIDRPRDRPVGPPPRPTPTRRRRTQATRRRHARARLATGHRARRRRG
jgi:hypothetical protein